MKKKNCTPIHVSLRPPVIIQLCHRGNHTNGSKEKHCADTISDYVIGTCIKMRKLLFMRAIMHAIIIIWGGVGWREVKRVLSIQQKKKKEKVSVEQLYVYVEKKKKNSWKI